MTYQPNHDNPYKRRIKHEDSLQFEVIGATDVAKILDRMATEVSMTDSITAVASEQLLSEHSEERTYTHEELLQAVRFGAYAAFYAVILEDNMGIGAQDDSSLWSEELLINSATHQANLRLDKERRQ